jgi:hypothetical protein
MPRELPPLEKDPVIEAYKKDVDRTLLRENLRLSYEERVIQLMKLIEAHDEAHRAGEAFRARRRSHGA